MAHGQSFVPALWRIWAYGSGLSPNLLGQKFGSRRHYRCLVVGSRRVGKSVSSSLLPPLAGSCGTPTSGIEEVRLNAAALSDPDSLLISISFPAFPSIFTNGLVDSGSSHCFINLSFVVEILFPS